METEKLDRRRFGRLKWAILHGHRGIIESLLDEDAPVNDRYDMHGYGMQRDFRSPLHSSVYLGDPKIVQKLLDKGASVNVINENDETALMLAAKFEKYDIVDLLLFNKRLKNCANREAFSHLHIACMRDRVDVVQKLLEHKTDVNTAVKSDAIYWSGYTPLHFAVQFKSIETVAFLLKAGADITIQDSKRLTALHLADMKRNDQMIDMILAAHKRVVKNPTNSEGLSHFHIACTRNDKGIVECFIKNGVTLNASVDETSWNWPNFTAIDFAIYYDCIDVVRLLLMEGGRKMFPSKGQGDKRSDIVKNAHHTGNEELADLVLSRDELAKEKSSRIQKLPALLHSCIHRDLADVKQSLSELPDSLNELMWQGSTPLHLAVERGDETIISYLIEQGADYSIKNADGKTSLHLAFERNMEEAMDLFLSNLDCIEGNPVNPDGVSHFHIACSKDEVEAVTKFIKLGVDVNAAVNDDSVFWPGFTPLRFAAKFESAKVARILLEHGASYSATNKNGQTAFDVVISGIEVLYQWRIRNILEIMRAILSTHLERKIDSFNDRGLSLLHILPPHYESDDKDTEIIIRKHQTDVNKAVNLTGTPWDGYTPLHFAMLKGEVGHAKLLLEFGADISSLSASGDYPYHLASYKYNDPQLPMTDLDFEKMKHNSAGSRGFSLFHAACAMGNMEWMKYFLDDGVDPNDGTNSHGYYCRDKTPLHWATSCYGGSMFRVVELLLDNDAIATLKDDHLNTPLHNMSSDVESIVIDLLICYGVDVNSRNAFLETPLISLCVTHRYSKDQQFSEKIQKLLNYGADINLADECGTTVLTVDTWEYNFGALPLCIEVLLKHVMKLKALGFYVSETNETKAQKLSARAARTLRLTWPDFPDECSKELEVMKEVRINASSSLYDILFKDLNGMAVFSENDEFQRILNSDDFREKYPIYGPMIKLQLSRGQDRRSLLADAVKKFKNLTQVSMPRECLERILQYFTDEDLENIIDSYDQS